MSETSFADRVAATGLTPKAEDLLRLEALVADMDRAAALVRCPRAYAEEPMSAFRLPVGSKVIDRFSSGPGQAQGQVRP